MIASLARVVGRAARGVRVAQTPREVLWREGRWSLLRFRGAAVHRTPVLLVPSLINRWYVLDLQPGRSLIEYLVARGHAVHCIDWGTPEVEDRFVDFDDICDGAIGRAVRVTARAAGASAVHLLGYCLGGTLAAIHAARRPDRVASLTTLAAPIDFARAGIMARWVQTPTFDAGAIAQALGNIPWPLLQASFHMLRPTLPFTKAVSLIDRARDDEFLDGFLATERWGNDNVALPGAWYQRYIDELYRENRLVHGTLGVTGVPVRLENITQPLLAVTFGHDAIAPAECSLPLLERVSSTDRHHLHLPGGHVGAVVSRKAGQHLWPALSDFWSARD